MGTRTAAKPASVRPIAGSVFFTSAPIASPSITAKIVYAIGTIPRRSKIPGSNRPEADAVTRGRLHHVTRTASAAEPAIANPTTINPCVEIHRFRVTPCVHANRCVPFSISRAISGAPKNMPNKAGAKRNNGIMN